uniref:Uncharacterized protein n=1 Tax=Anguilla anguilla TaxID=7936 RepID=A0A0E9R7I4_ANGAN
MSLIIQLTPKLLAHFIKTHKMSHISGSNI